MLSCYIIPFPPTEAFQLLLIAHTESSSNSIIILIIIMMQDSIVSTVYLFDSLMIWPISLEFHLVKLLRVSLGLFNVLRHHLLHSVSHIGMG